MPIILHRFGMSSMCNTADDVCRVYGTRFMLTHKCPRTFFLLSLSSLCRPTIYIIGAQKGGTTSLANFLFRYSMFCRNNGRIGQGKESHYFTNVLQQRQGRRERESARGGRSAGKESKGERMRGGDGIHHEQQHAKRAKPFAYYTITGSDDKCMLARAQKGDYERALEGKGPPILSGRLYKRGKHVDATPVLSYPGFAAVLSSALPPALLPRLRFIVLLREPLSRDISMYNHMIGIRSKWGFCKEALETAGRNGEGATDMPSYHQVLAANLQCWRTPAQCSECIRAQMAYGHYASQLKEWFAAFGRQSFFVLDSDALKHEAATARGRGKRALLLRLGQFLGVPAHDDEWERLLANGLSDGSNSARHFVAGRAFSAHLLGADECKAAADMYREWNEELYALMNATHDAAPPMQPRFIGFQPPCALAK